ncbi:TPA: DNA mismatch endonuclease Vsr [Burkholderia vietnamiensis]|nr:DNA mismatch endonuclease Vsr [Burkholderia vietnamiensis]
MDNLERSGRAALMRRVKRKNTTPELAVRRMLHARGYRYTLHNSRLPGCPDIVFSRRRKVVFVHGCFWHGHTCRHGRLPKTNVEFWERKIAQNRARDERVERELMAMGWSTYSVWQCEIKDADLLLTVLSAFLGPPSHGRITRRATIARA